MAAGCDFFLGFIPQLPEPLGKHLWYLPACCLPAPLSSDWANVQNIHCRGMEGEAGHLYTGEIMWSGSSSSCYYVAPGHKFDTTISFLPDLALGEHRQNLKSCSGIAILVEKIWPHLAARKLQPAGLGPAFTYALPMLNPCSSFSMHAHKTVAAGACMWGTFKIWPQRKIYEQKQVDNYSANENGNSPFLCLGHPKLPLRQNAFIRWMYIKTQDRGLKLG